MFSLPLSKLPCVSIPTFTYQTSSIFNFTAPTCMDTNPPTWARGGSVVRRKPLQLSKSASSPLQPTDRGSSGQKHQHYTSSPLPQTEWSKTEQRLRSHLDSGLRRQSSHTTHRVVPNFSRPPGPTSAPADWEGQPPTEGRNDEDDGHLLSEEDDSADDQQTPIDIPSLYPHMNPYTDRRSTHSAPDEMEHSPSRSLEDDSSAYSTYMTISNEEENTLPPHALRNSTYPPPTVRRARSTSIIPDTTFADEADINLFAQAMSGLGLDEPFGPPFSSSPPTRSSPSRNLHPPAVAPPQSSSASLPYREDHTTPVITQAIRQLEQLLGESRPPPAAAPPSFSSPSFSAPAVEQRELTPSEHNLRAEAIEAAAFEAEMARWQDEFADHDDELPDYAQSQAQAQAHQRIEAARRAQELQRRWQLSGSRRPI